MNLEMSYLLGMVLGNGEIQQNTRNTTVTIDIPFKNLKTDDLKDVAIYVKASVVDIRTIIEPLIGNNLEVTETKNSIKLTFVKYNEEYVVRELLRLIGSGKHHSNMKMSDELFSITRDEKIALIRGFADVTGYIRKSNRAFGKDANHRVYLEIPRNWYMVIDIANMLKSIDIPVHTIDFGHPNFRDGNVKKYNEGKPYFWKKEHQVKIWATEFLPIGFNIKHKQESLDKYANEQKLYMNSEKTHKFYWEKDTKRRNRPNHPCESDDVIPKEIRGMHFESWTDLAKIMGYGK